MKTKWATLSVIIFLFFFKIIVSNFNLGVSTDSIQYINIAKNISLGEEISNHWPPLYPILLLLSSKLLGMEFSYVGVYLNMFLLVLLAYVYIQILKLLKFDNLLISFFPLLLLLSSPMEVSIFFLSELPFITFLMGIVLCFMLWDINHLKHYLLLASILSLILVLTRYAGIGFIGGFIIIIMLHDNIKIVNVIRNLLIYLLPILMGLFLWYWFCVSMNTNPTDRDLAVHFIPFSAIVKSFKAIISWFLMDYFSLLIFSSFLLVTIFLIRNKIKYFQLYIKKEQRYIVSFFICIISYYIFLLASISFFDAHTKMNSRILSPICPILFLLFGLVLNFIIKEYKGIAKYLPLIIFSISIIYSSTNLWLNHYQNGSGFTSVGFITAKKFIQLNKVANDEKLIFSNGGDLIQFYNSYRKGISFIPYTLNPGSLIINQNYEIEVNNMFDKIKSGDANLIYFENIDWRWYLMTKQELMDKFKDFTFTYFDGGFYISNHKKTPNGQLRVNCTRDGT